MTMTDEPVIEEAPVVVPDDASSLPSDDGKVPCPDCGEMYVAGTGLSRHMMAQHGTNPSQEITNCPECGKQMSKTSLYRHLRNVHNVHRRPKKKVAAANTPAAPPKPKAQPLSAEEVTRAAAQALWPKGVPHENLAALLAWNEQTRDFLEAVRRGV